MRKFREKFRKILEIWICRVFGGAKPPKLAKILKKISPKINGNLQNFENFHEFLANFDLKRLILLKIKATLLEFWKSIIILEEIKKPSGKILRVWAKNQLRFEICEKILKFTYKNLNGKLIFYPFSLPSSRTFVILCTSGTYQNFWGWLGGVVPPGLVAVLSIFFWGGAV